MVHGVAQRAKNITDLFFYILRPLLKFCAALCRLLPFLENFCEQESCVSRQTSEL